MALFCNAGWPARHWAERAGVFHLTLRLFFSVRSDDIRNTRSGLLELGSFFLFLRAPRVTLLATVQPGLLCAQTNLDARATCTPTSGSSLTNRLPPKTYSTFLLVRLRQDPLASDKTTNTQHFLGLARQSHYHKRQPATWLCATKTSINLQCRAPFAQLGARKGPHHGQR